jgi:hypothetical protein
VQRTLPRSHAAFAATIRARISARSINAVTTRILSLEEAMRRNALVFALAGVAVAVAAWTLVPARPGAPTKPAPVTAPAVATQTSSTATNAGAPVAAGYVVRLDGNGKLSTDPQSVSDAEFNTEMAKMINTSSEGLQPETLSNGALKINLQGRFMSASVATTDAHGKVIVPCLTNENDVKAFEKTGAADQAARKE